MQVKLFLLTVFGLIRYIVSRFTSLVYVLPLTFMYYPQELEKVNCKLRETREKMKDVERETAKEVEETREEQRRTEGELERVREQLAGKETEAIKSLKDEIEKLKQHHLQEVCKCSKNTHTHTKQNAVLHVSTSQTASQGKAKTLNTILTKT